MDSAALCVRRTPGRHQHAAAGIRGANRTARAGVAARAPLVAVRRTHNCHTCRFARRLRTRPRTDRTTEERGADEPADVFPRVLNRAWNHRQTHKLEVPLQFPYNFGRRGSLGVRWVQPTVMAANGGSLADRIARLLGQPSMSPRPSCGPGTAATLILLAIGAYAVSLNPTFGRSLRWPRLRRLSPEASRTCARFRGVWLPTRRCRFLCLEFQGH